MTQKIKCADLKAIENGILLRVKRALMNESNASPSDGEGHLFTRMPAKRWDSMAAFLNDKDVIGMANAIAEKIASGVPASGGKLHAYDPETSLSVAACYDDYGAFLKFRFSFDKNTLAAWLKQKEFA